jgi:putative transposase
VFPVERPRVRSADGRREVRLATYEYFADRDPLSRSVLERMLAGVSTRRYRRTQEPVGTGVERAARSTSKSSVSRAFIERTRVSLSKLMSRRLDDVRLAVMMLDGLELRGRTNVVALGITTEGVKIPLGSGKARPKTRPSPPRCSRTWSSAASTPTRGSCS